MIRITTERLDSGRIIAFFTGEPERFALGDTHAEAIGYLVTMFQHKAGLDWTIKRK